MAKKLFSKLSNKGPIFLGISLITLVVIVIVIILVSPLRVTLFRSKAAEVRCYYTNGIRVCHNPDDQSVFYDTPLNEVAYNVQTIRDGQNYWTIYHSEPKNKTAGYGGDSIKVGSFQGAYNYAMPTNKSFKIWGTQTDSLSALYSLNSTSSYKSVSGGGDPMVIAGRHWVGDNYYYVFFLVVKDDDGDRTEGENDYRNYLAEARTLDFINFDILTEQGWKSFNERDCSRTPEQCRPKTLTDSGGQVIRSNRASSPETYGLIGSISIVNKVYYYFYTDIEPTDPVVYNLYYRTSLDMNQPWSAPTKITNSNHQLDRSIVKIAKAKNKDRWAVLYTCRNTITFGHDLCLEYTQNMNVIGAGGISSLRLKSSRKQSVFPWETEDPQIHPSLGILGDGVSRPAEPYFMTDKNGVLVSPDTEDSNSARGGEIRWTDFETPGCTNPGCPIYGGKVWRAGWDSQ